MTAPLAVLGIDVGDLVADVIRGLLDLLVPDFATEWAAQFVTWLVALPDVTGTGQFERLNAFRVGLTQAAWGLLGLSLAVGALGYWTAGFTDSRSAGGLDAVRRAALAAAALAAYPTVVAQGILAVNHLTAVVVKHPQVVDGLDTALGGALVLGAVSSGLTLGLAIGAVLAALFFMAAVMVMKIALTAVLCVLLVAGGLVIALYPLPQGDALVRAWVTGLACCAIVPISWAVIFAVAGLVSADALAWTGGLGEGLEAIVKPFVAVACFYLAFRAPAFLLAQARMLGLRVPYRAGVERSPGGDRLGRSVQRHTAAHGQRFAAIGHAAIGAPAARTAAAALRGARAGGRAGRRAAATAAVNVASAANLGDAGAERITRGTERVVGAVDAAGRGIRGVGAAGRTAHAWWAQAASPAGHRPGSHAAADASAQDPSGRRASASSPAGSSKPAAAGPEHGSAPRAAAAPPTGGVRFSVATRSTVGRASAPPPADGAGRFAPATAAGRTPSHPAVPSPPPAPPARTPPTPSAGTAPVGPPAPTTAPRPAPSSGPQRSTPTGDDGHAPPNSTRPAPPKPPQGS